MPDWQCTDLVSETREIVTYGERKRAKEGRPTREKETERVSESRRGIPDTGACKQVTCLKPLVELFPY